MRQSDECVRSSDSELVRFSGPGAVHTVGAHEILAQYCFHPHSQTLGWVHGLASGL